MTLDQSEISSRGFWLTDTSKGHCFDEGLSAQLKDLFTGHSVLDLGCGNGSYTRQFLSASIPCKCFDGNPNTKTISNNLCDVADLTKEQTFEVADWVLCLEVGEHIPQEYESTFLQNIINHSRKGIVLSWGVPGQPGDGHINCRPNEYVISSIEKHGYVLDEETSLKLRQSSELWWFKNTILVFKKMEMPKITFCIPSKSNLRYLKTSIDSIRKNSFRKDHDIIVFVDSDEDGTVEWLKQHAEEYKVTYYVNPELNTQLYGIGKAYDYCIEKATTEVVMIFHADMMLGKNADVNAYKHLSNSKVVCSTRIEPPIHPNTGEKILQDFGMWPEEFKETEFNDYVVNLLTSNKNKTSEGIFAPWMIHKQDILSIGGHDPIMHSAREDSDLFNRFVLNGYELIQSWDSLVYHLTGRGGQFQHGVVTKDETQKSEEWQKLMINSTKEFMRKWGSTVKHTPMMKPVIPHKYDIKFEVVNMQPQMLNVFEPMCDALSTDLTKEQIDHYIYLEQSNTTFDLKKRLYNTDNHDITVKFDCAKLNNQNFYILQNLSEILDGNEIDVGTYEFDVFTIVVNNVVFYENKLIHK